MRNLIRITIFALELLGFAIAHGQDVKPADPVLVSPAVLDVEEVDGFYVSRRLASVRIGSGGGCSGTIVFIGEWNTQEAAFGLSANHCGYAKNSTFTVWFVDGSKAVARCIDTSETSDLMLFVVDSKAVLGVAPFCSESTDDESYAVGFPDGRGPEEKVIRFVDVEPRMNEFGTGRAFRRNVWAVAEGEFAPGDSGGGVFSGDYFVGVITHGRGSPLYATTHAEVASFLRRDRRIRDRPCENGRCEPGGPRDLWWLRPNVDVEIPRFPRHTDPNDIEKRRRPDINGPLEQKKAIAELQVAMKDLVARVEELENNRCRCAENDLPIPGHEAPPAPEPPDVSEFEERIRDLEAALAASEEWNKELSTRLVKLEVTKPAKGEKGDPGPQGPAGPKGEPGEPGPERDVMVVFQDDKGSVIAGPVKVPPGKDTVRVPIERFVKK